MRIKRCLDFIVVDFGLFMGKYTAYLRDCKINVEDLVIYYAFLSAFVYLASPNICRLGHENKNDFLFCIPLGF